MDKKEYKCKFCDKVFSNGKNKNRHEKVDIFFHLSGKISQGEMEHSAWGSIREAAPAALTPSGGRQWVLNSLGTCVHLCPGDLDPQPLVK